MPFCKKKDICDKFVPLKLEKCYAENCYSSLSWIPVSEKLPSSDKLSYPIIDSDGCADYCPGKIIREDYEESLSDTEEICRIKWWLDCPLPDWAI